MFGGGRKYLYLDFMPFAIGSSMSWAITQDILLPQFATDLSGRFRKLPEAIHWDGAPA